MSRSLLNFEKRSLSWLTLRGPTCRQKDGAGQGLLEAEQQANRVDLPLPDEDCDRCTPKEEFALSGMAKMKDSSLIQPLPRQNWR
jgi:hypothetical protein